MPFKQLHLNQLAGFLPPDTYPAVERYLAEYRIHLTITRARQTILGDYRHRHGRMNHRITVNGNLNPYSFLITLLHEIAHLLAFEQHGNRILSHGKEWKKIYGGLLSEFMRRKIFPPDIETELMRALANPAASSCAEEGLTRVLRNYDRNRGLDLVEELENGAIFMTPDGKKFRKGERLRKRFKCVELTSGREFLFSPVYEVKKIPA